MRKKPRFGMSLAIKVKVTIMRHNSIELRQLTEGRWFFMNRLKLCVWVVLISVTFGAAKLIAGGGPPPPPTPPSSTNTVPPVLYLSVK